MSIKVFIIARMRSSRLPGKVLKRVCGVPLLGLLIERMECCQKIEDIILTTSDCPQDDVIAEFGRERNISVFRGSESNTIDRLYRAALAYSADPIIRVTSDCPFLEPNTVDAIAEKILNGTADYVSTDLVPTYPCGMGCDAFRLDALEKLYHLSISGMGDEVLDKIRDPELGFKLDTIEGPEVVSNYRLTVDTAEDFELVKRIAESLYPENPNFVLNDIRKVFEKHPQWLKINAHIKQKTGPHSKLI